MKIKISVILTLVLLLVLVNGCIEQNPETDDDSSSDDRKTDNENIEPDNHNDTNNVDNNEVDDEEEVEQEQYEEVTIDYKDSGIILEIIMDDEDIRAYDRVNYSVPNAPSGSNITWEMGDGTVLYGMKVLYFHRSSDYFQVNVTAKWDDLFAFGTQEVAVKNQDWDFSIYSKTTYTVVGLKASSGGPVINKGISYPEVIMEMEFINLTGRIEFGVEVVLNSDQEPPHERQELVIESLVGKWDNYTFEWAFSPEIMSQFEQSRPYTISCFYRWVGAVGHTEYLFSWLIYF